jgi:AmiR/NasT family two-component response regulator
MLLERIQLANQRTRLEAALSSLRADLATRKLVQRAQGILVARQHVTPAAAKLWLSQQARQARLSVPQFAARVVAMENAQRERPFIRSRQRRIA